MKRASSSFAKMKTVDDCGGCKMDAKTYKSERALFHLVLSAYASNMRTPLDEPMQSSSRLHKFAAYHTAPLIQTFSKSNSQAPSTKWIYLASMHVFSRALLLDHVATPKANFSVCMTVSCSRHPSQQHKVLHAQLYKTTIVDCRLTPSNSAIHIRRL